MISFRKQQEKIIKFITDNYNDFLPPHLQNPQITTAFLDFDKYKNDFTVFVDFAEINFEQSDFRDDCEDTNYLNIIIYLVHRNNTSEILQENNLDSAYAFYRMIRKKPDLLTIYDIKINSIDFYNYVEASKYLVVTEINISLQI
jgi:mRNA-degrading endonuclease YafQ of YafQ-DinJ toxin-antitoxin module